MLNISTLITDKKLSILLPNTNKILAKALANTSSSQLKEITQAKDLKSILNSLLVDSRLNDEADKALLKIVKNNPTFKDLKNVSRTLKDLSTTLKSDEKLQPILKDIQKIIPNIKEIQNTDIKSTLKNSGVFLESNLKEIKDPQIKLTSVITELSKTLQKSELPSAKIVQELVRDIKENINKQTSKNEIDTKLVKQESIKALEPITSNIKKIINTIESELKLASPITSEKFSTKIQNLERLVLPFIQEKEQKTKVSKDINNLNNDIKAIVKELKEPQIKLTDTLKELTQTLQKNEIPNSKVIQTKIDAILEKFPTKELQINLKNELEASKHTNETQQKPLIAVVKSADVAKNIQNIQTVIQDIKEVTKELKTNIQNITNETKQIDTKELTTKLQKIENLEKEGFTLIQNINEKVKIKVSNEIVLAKKQENDIDVKDIKIPVITAASVDVSKTLKTDFTNSSKSLFDALVKIINVLKTVDTPQLLIDKKIPEKLNLILNEIKSEIKSADPIFSKEVKVALKELTLLNAPQKLSFNENIKELLSNDLKAVLLKASEDVAKLPSSVSQSETLKQMDKLSLAIDYYQLVSHLSDSSSLYLPISWDEMQEGEISIKKMKNNTFFCDIELKLKEYKELKLRLSIYDKNKLNIDISSDSQKLKKLMNESMNELRSALRSLKITPNEIRFFNYSKPNFEKSYDTTNKDLDIGFEIKA